MEFKMRRRVSERERENFWRKKECCCSIFFMVIECRFIFSKFNFFYLLIIRFYDNFLDLYAALSLFSLSLLRVLKGNMCWRLNLYSSFESRVQVHVCVWYYPGIYLNSKKRTICSRPFSFSLPTPDANRYF